MAARQLQARAGRAALTLTHVADRGGLVAALLAACSARCASRIRAGLLVRADAGRSGSRSAHWVTTWGEAKTLMLTSPVGGAARVGRRRGAASAGRARSLCARRRRCSRSCSRRRAGLRRDAVPRLRTSRRRARYEELASLDSRFAGSGPTLFTDFDEYSLYELRDLDVGGPDFVYPPPALAAAARRLRRPGRPRSHRAGGAARLSADHHAPRPIGEPPAGCVPPALAGRLLPGVGPATGAPRGARARRAGGLAASASARASRRSRARAQSQRRAARCRSRQAPRSSSRCALARRSPPAAAGRTRRRVLVIELGRTLSARVRAFRAPACGTCGCRARSCRACRLRVDGPATGADRRAAQRQLAGHRQRAADPRAAGRRRPPPVAAARAARRSRPATAAPRSLDAIFLTPAGAARASLRRSGLRLAALCGGRTSGSSCPREALPRPSRPAHERAAGAGGAHAPSGRERSLPGRERARAQPPASDQILLGDNLELLPALRDGSFQLVYVDPPFNTGKRRAPDAARGPRRSGGARRASGAALPDRAARRDSSYRDSFDDYLAFLEPRLQEAHRLLRAEGTLYFHIDYREAHYCKLLLDEIFGRECFLNEIIWAYDYGARSQAPLAGQARHDPRLRQGPRRVLLRRRGGRPRALHGARPGHRREGRARQAPDRRLVAHDRAHHGREKTGYPTQKPEGIVRRMVQASSRPGDWCLDFFAGSGTLGAVAAQLGRRYVLIDSNPEAVEVHAGASPRGRGRQARRARGGANARRAAVMYHVELRQFPHNRADFNLSRRRAARRSSSRGAARTDVEFGERKWSPQQAKLTILEGPAAALAELSMGRGWRAAQRAERGRHRARSLAPRRTAGAAAQPPPRARGRLRRPAPSPQRPGSLIRSPRGSSSRRCWA